MKLSRHPKLLQLKLFGVVSRPLQKWCAVFVAFFSVALTLFYPVVASQVEGARPRQNQQVES
jgi:hypothetical protein